MRSLSLLIFSLFLTPLIAHDLEVVTEFASPAVIMRATYGGTEPAAYAEVLIYSPVDRKTEYQNGRTDAKGGFSFLPDRNGDWLFVIDDELGHRQEVKVPVSPGALSVGTIQMAGSMGTAQKAITGMAIILGATGLLFWWKARQMVQRSEG